jgi:hypothetical protein
VTATGAALCLARSVHITLELTVLPAHEDPNEAIMMRDGRMVVATS